MEEEGVGLIHATAQVFFRKSEFTPVYICLKMLNFSQIPETIACLENALETFKNDSSRCQYKQNYFANLEYIVDNYHFE